MSQTPARRIAGQLGGVTFLALLLAAPGTAAAQPGITGGLAPPAELTILGIPPPRDAISPGQLAEIRAAIAALRGAEGGRRRGGRQGRGPVPLPLLPPGRHPRPGPLPQQLHRPGPEPRALPGLRLLRLRLRRPPRPRLADPQLPRAGDRRAGLRRASRRRRRRPRRRAGHEHRMELRQQGQLRRHRPRRRLHAGSTSTCGGAASRWRRARRSRPGRSSA